MLFAAITVFFFLNRLPSTRCIIVNLLSRFFEGKCLLVIINVVVKKKTTKFAIEQKEDEHLDETILFAHLFVFEVVLSSQF